MSNNDAATSTWQPYTQPSQMHLQDDHHLSPPQAWALVGSGFVGFECPKMFLRSLNGIWGWIGFCGQICRQPTRPSDLHRIRDSKSLLIFRSWQPRQACRSVKALTTVFTESNIPKYSCLKYDDDDDADIYIGDKDLMKIIIWGALKESDIWDELLLGFSSLKCGSGSGCFW